MKVLNDAVRRYTQAHFFVRLIKMRQVIRLQWLINERNKGRSASSSNLDSERPDVCRRFARGRLA